MRYGFRRLLPAVLALMLLLVTLNAIGPSKSSRVPGQLDPFSLPQSIPVKPVRHSTFLEAWRVPLGSPLAGPLLESPGGIVASLESGTIAALSLEDGRILWKSERPEKPAGGPVVAGPYVVQAFAKGELSALKLTDGSEAWVHDFEEPITHSATGSAEDVYLALDSAKLVAFHMEGSERWRASLTSAPSTPPSACRGFVVVGTEGGTVESFERKSGKLLWIARTASPVRSPILCHQGALYFGTGDNRMWALSYSGRRKWRFPAGAQCVARPFALDRRIYFLSFDNYLYALKARSGSLLLRVRLSHRLADEAFALGDRLYLSPYTSAKLLALSLPDLVMAGEYHLEMEGDWFTTPPLKIGDRVFLGYGRYEGRILALKETLEPPAAKAGS
ncbi:MAG TPA: PQQ-binding-like beta-propeller repeat protein [Candidatus Polarisedimenticolia bacterium]|nr:PQQ-binding-like beta-propeller repeat protein [Candidatus Polarisedimenticolia bacterium]